MGWKYWLMAGAGVLGLTAGAGMGTGGVARGQGFADQPAVFMPTDANLVADVSDSLAKDAALNLDNIQVSVDNGVVTLTGSVNNDGERKRALRDAQSIAGVAAVRDNIMINERDY